MSIEAYPLCWPQEWPRTKQPVDSRFMVTQDRAQTLMFKEIIKLGGTDIILSTNIRLRRDGFPYASQRQPEDRGVAVYFTYKKQSMAFACDKYCQLGDNIHAIGKTIEALRGIERWGASDMMARAFTGFAQLTHQPYGSWRSILEAGEDYSKEQCEHQFRILAKVSHPDQKEGSHQKMTVLLWAREEMRKELRL